MGDLTRTQLATEVANVVGRELGSLSTDAATTLQTRIESYYLEWAQLRMSRAYAFPEFDQVKETGVTANNTYRYSYATLGITDASRILGVVYVDGTNSRKLKNRQMRDILEKRPRPEADSTAAPEIYMDFGRSLELIPVPNAAKTLSVRISAWPSVFSGATDTSDYIKKDDLVVHAGVVETFLALRMFKEADAWLKVFASKMAEAVRPYADPSDWEPEGRAWRSDLFPSYEDTGEYWRNPFIMSVT